MIRLKKKNEEKTAAAAVAAASAAASDAANEKSPEESSTAVTKMEVTTTSESGGDSSGGSLKLLGIGGKSIRSDEGTKKTGKKKTPGELRIQKDITDLDGGSVAQVDFPNPNDLTNFSVVVSPDSGYWMGAKYHFNFAIPAIYPHEPPKVTCLTKIYHPNIDLAGAVCLNILREDWKPVLDINAVIYGLIYLFYEPNPDDPLNREAADLYRNDKAQFGRVVKRTLQGHSHGGESFPRLV